MRGLREARGGGQTDAMTDLLANIEIGMTGEAEVVVTPDITVGGHVPGRPMVYGTPFMILLMEIASGRAIAAHLPDGRLVNIVLQDHGYDRRLMKYGPLPRFNSSAAL